MIKKKQLQVLIELQLFTSSGRVFHQFVAFTAKDDSPNAVMQNGMVQSHMHDILEDLIELTEQL